MVVNDTTGSTPERIWQQQPLPKTKEEQRAYGLGIMGQIFLDRLSGIPEETILTKIVLATAPVDVKGGLAPQEMLAVILDQYALSVAQIQTAKETGVDIYAVMYTNPRHLPADFESTLRNNFSVTRSQYDANLSTLATGQKIPDQVANLMVTSYLATRNLPVLPQPPTSSVK